MAVIHEEPILSRLDRLDNMLRHLEDMKGCNKSPRSSGPSTPSSGTLMSDGHASSMDFSPRTLEKHCRPIDRVVMEVEVKGSLLQRLAHVEDRVLKLEEEIEAEKKRDKEEGRGRREKEDNNKNKKKKKKGLKQLVKQVVKGSPKHHRQDDH